jgi:ankyrin repeat protein
MKPLQTSLVLLLLLPFTVARGAETISARLQQALFEEEANRNLPAAIAGYEAILKAHEEERRFAATALFRLGECYRKLSKTNEAVAQYQRLLREFPEQRTLIPLAEQNLAALGSPTTVLAASEHPRRPASPEERKLIEEQIRLAERQLTEARKRIEIGVQAVSSDAPYQRTLIRLRRELAMLNEPPGGPEQQKLLSEEIQLQEKVVRQIRDHISKGLAPSSSELEPQRELLSLKRELVALESSAKSPAPGPTRDTTAEGTGRPAERTGEDIEIARIEALLKDSPDLINVRTGGSEPPLHQAVSKGYRRVVEFLLNHGADVDIGPPALDTALQWAVRNGQRAIVELLLNHKARVELTGKSGDAPLTLAASSGFKAIAELLLARGADVNATNRFGSSALHQAVRQNRPETVELLLAHHADINALADEGTPLRLAVLSGWVKLARLLLERGAKPDIRHPNSGTPLVAAAWQKSGLEDELTELLLRHGADPNIRFATKMATSSDLGPDRRGSNPSQQYVDTSEVTPLISAAAAGSVPVLKRLLDAGARLDSRDSLGYTALHWATMRNTSNALAFLLERGANPNIQDREGATPLLLAIRDNYEAAALLLLEHKADPNIATPGNPMIAGSSGATPLQSAVRRGGVNLVVALLDHGADVHACNRAGENALTFANQRNTQEMANLLRERGASESAPRPGFLTVCRASSKLGWPIFSQGTNSPNHHTLLELFACAFQQPPNMPGPLVFPDLEHVRINRLVPATGKIQEIVVNIVSILQSNDCSKDVRLQWGDTVEFAERDHPSNEGWSGFATADNEPLVACLARDVQVIVKGETNRLHLLPSRLQQSPTVLPPRILTPPPPPGAPPLVFQPPQATAIGTLNAAPPAWHRQRQIYAFWLRDVLVEGNVIRASSDLTRVKVTRVEPETGKKLEFVQDCSTPRGPSFNVDLWLQNGDVIELPER